MVFSITYKQADGATDRRTFQSDTKRKARWLAINVLGPISIIDIQHVHIKQPLENEEDA